MVKDRQPEVEGGQIKRKQSYEDFLLIELAHPYVTDCMQSILLDRIKKEDLPLFIHYPWVGLIRQQFLNKLNGDCL